MLYAFLLTFIVNYLVVVKSVTEFPEGFLFGVATASYQIEGAWNACGKGENIWDHMVHTYPERIVDGSTGDIACDSYRYYTEDVSYLTYLGVNYYRFSISWSRLLPTGFANYINPDGQRYYDNLIQHLKRNGIVPMVTLYHWDLPQPLQELGGWTNPILANYFQDYANIVFSLYGEHVPFWITFNEPGEICVTGYGLGINAPNVKLSGTGDYQCGRTLLLAHAAVYHLFKRKYRSKCQGRIGITISSPWYEPRNDTEKEASERALLMEFGWWANPIFSKKGDYPEIMKDRIERFSYFENLTCSRLPKFTKAEIKFIRGSADFLGLNHYTTYLVSGDERPINSMPSHEKDVGVLKEQDEKWEPSSASWLRVVPWGFKKLLIWIKEKYDNPLIYITENGFADKGELKDTRRINYHATYVKAMLEAISEEKCNVKGYTIWSLLDNMEWTDGYTIKFGLYYVDFNESCRRRLPKSSVEYYKALILNRQIPAVNDSATEKLTTCIPATTESPTTCIPATTENPTCIPDTTENPTCIPATIENPATCIPATTENPTCIPATIENPTTCIPATTENPTTCIPVTTENPTTCIPVTTENPTICIPVTTENPTCVPVAGEEPTTCATIAREEPTTCATIAREETTTCIPAKKTVSPSVQRV